MNGGIPLLDGLAEEVVADFLSLAEHAAFPRGARLFTEGEPGDCVLVLLSGKVKATRPSPEGGEILLNMAGPGELLGELRLFDTAPRQATATAVQETTAYRAPVKEMSDWIDRHPEAARRVMGLLAARIRRMNDRIEDAAGVDVATRVARVLVEQGARFARRTSVGLRLTLDLSQDDLAHHVRASRERVNQILVDFTRRGWITRDGGDLLILDAPQLTRRARHRSRRPSLP
ncbi:Crp/Fnr family transcriptional regulator [Nonomuraea endophytica]|uniref:CRP/FNR family transcriptional regulator n=1 Tax=Nonomuraea endophytica TaxID=714136 RepID=A0A7W8A3N1_9ACTN|nr:Crp/Fnr family transcriptional regulator [Nonomuraea endophytica]MBB5078943.1 CRP/FNR family transcriptional regulator [Nonomuraea endophytica]